MCVCGYGRGVGVDGRVVAGGGGLRSAAPLRPLLRPALHCSAHYPLSTAHRPTPSQSWTNASTI